jgi:hypothetical protein|tara:strand:+ start:313 stop:1140 length:828 start_codon:yes stop_codon:yes gene_type:complete
MNNLTMFCLTLEPSHLDFIKKLNYIPVGLGEKKFSNEWLTDKDGENISEKNKNYGEYTFHYWLWKNHIKKINTNWIGFGQYRKFWTIKNYDNAKLDMSKMNSLAIKEIPENFDDCEVILGHPFYVNQRRISKFVKKGFKLILKKPGVLFNKNQRNLKFHFDLMHGEGNLRKAINLLDSQNKKFFAEYMEKNFYFHPHNMFICKSKELLFEYYETIFPWLNRCESIFGFKNLRGYDLTRIYGFLAERFLSYWFTKNAKYKTMNITFYDINNDLKNT